EGLIYLSRWNRHGLFTERGLHCLSLTEPGRNLQNEDIVWVDYDAAVSMHRVRANRPEERRLERLVSATPLDNRISYGCINVPAKFYDRYLQPTFGRTKAVMYILPEKEDLKRFFAIDDTTR
ncbi:MAG TPA: hypothetical protein PLX65_13175, partial [Accumulibacter sp.]|nr:hypothetical protein [Accumulibacter sp.]